MPLPPRASDEALANWAAITPTVHQCLQELTEELSCILHWAHLSPTPDGSIDETAFRAALSAWGLEPVSFLAATLKRRNPTRLSCAVREARAKKKALDRATYDAPATIFDSSLGAVLASYPNRPNSANRDHPIDKGAAAPDVSNGFTPEQAREIIRRLTAGAIYSGGTQLPILQCDGSTALLRVPAAPLVKDSELILMDELALARSRADAAMPSVFGTEQALLPPPQVESQRVSIPLDELSAWLQSAGWTAYTLPSDFAMGLYDELVSHSFVDPRRSSALLSINEGVLDLSPFTRKSQPHEDAVGTAVRLNVDLRKVVGLGPFMLQSELVRAELRCADNLAEICLAPLGSEVMRPQDILLPYRTTEYVRATHFDPCALKGLLS